MNQDSKNNEKTTIHKYKPKELVDKILAVFRRVDNYKHLTDEQIQQKVHKFLYNCSECHFNSDDKKQLVPYVDPKKHAFLPFKLQFGGSSVSGIDLRGPLNLINLEPSWNSHRGNIEFTVIARPTWNILYVSPDPPLFFSE